jgi:hypothetical protein
MVVCLLVVEILVDLVVGEDLLMVLAVLEL